MEGAWEDHSAFLIEQSESIVNPFPAETETNLRLLFNQALNFLALHNLPVCEYSLQLPTIQNPIIFRIVLHHLFG